jgi:hypothetical protein
VSNEIALAGDWYQSLIDDCRAIITEAVFNSRWELIAGYHQLGMRIVEDKNLKWNARGNGETLTGLSKSAGIGERDLYRAIQFYNKYPQLDRLPEGKNISWNKIVTNYLPKDKSKSDQEKRFEKTLRIRLVSSAKQLLEKYQLTEAEKIVCLSVVETFEVTE